MNIHKLATWCQRKIENPLVAAAGLEAQADTIQRREKLIDKERKAAKKEKRDYNPAVLADFEPTQPEDVSDRVPSLEFCFEICEEKAAEAKKGAETLGGVKHILLDYVKEAWAAEQE